MALTETQPSYDGRKEEPVNLPVKLPVVLNNKLLGIVTAADMVAAEPKMMEQLGELTIFAKKQKRIAG